MKNVRRGVIGLIVAAVTLVAAQDVAEIKSLIANRTDAGRKAVGIVFGSIDASGERITAGGTTAPGGTAAPDADTVFEIGSITKVFTSLVLADMVERGEVSLDDPVAKYLPPAVRMPVRNGREITLGDLSTQVSGLPRLPDNLKPADSADPYADYGPARLYEFLSGYTLTRDIGEKYEYSNLGVGLLGHALALKAGLSYEELVRRRILEPLEMKDTAITLSDALKTHLATGTNASLRPVKNWGFDALAAAGALRSTANDMLKFLAAAMGLHATPLRPAFDRMLQARRPTGIPELEIALGWHIWKRYGTEIIWHNGGTGGFRSFAGFDPAKKKGVVVLCNTSLSVDDLGLHALEPRWSVARFRPPLKNVRLVVLDAGNPGPVKLGFYIELETGWHLYWVNPGDAGLAPNARWTLPAGFTAGPLRHPVPAKHVQDGIVSLDHQDQVLLVCEIAPPPTGWPGGPWEAAAVLEWMACRESCITGETPVKAVMPPDSASLAEGRSLFEKFASRFPRPLSESGLTAGSARAEWTGSAWRVEVALAGPRASEAQDFFAYPVEGYVVDNPGVACRDGKIICPLIPSRGPGAPPPSAIRGILIVAGAGYEISIPVPSRRLVSRTHFVRIMEITS